MTQYETKLITTATIWLAITVITVALLVAEQFNFMVLAILAVCALFSTAAIWAGSKSDEASRVVQNAEKSKRRPRIEQVLDELNDDELDALRARLMSDTDGELVSVDELLDKIDQRELR